MMAIMNSAELLLVVGEAPAIITLCLRSVHPSSCHVGITSPTQNQKSAKKHRRDLPSRLLARLQQAGRSAGDEPNVAPPRGIARAALMADRRAWHGQRMGPNLRSPPGNRWPAPAGWISTRSIA